MTDDRWPKLIGLRNHISGCACDADARVGKSKHVNHSTANRNTAAPVVMSSPPIPVPRPDRAPRESAGAQGRLNDRQATRAGKNRSVIIRPSDDEEQRARPRAVLREVARRVSIPGGMIVLPKVA